ncbi:MAG: phosphoribosylformylglycinamidine synthase subunit PurQ [Nitrospinae bacterium]|nr:phosphoribosylformylglycinamidine synthase subunit PurQ [Nitrospinota bacterium]
MKVGVVVFPGSNCDRDTLHVASLLPGAQVRSVWHKETSLGDCNLAILPGGFSYGDYLRCGAIARFSPVMKAVADFAQKGGTVIGICNGFQVLTESHLLPGVLLPNESRKFICKNVHLRVERTDIPATRGLNKGDVLKMPIAHGDGNFFADEEAIARLEKNGQVVVRYCDERGNVTAEANPNGARNNIAGICNERGNVFGLMPHPERCSEDILGNTDGFRIFKSLATL